MNPDHRDSQTYAIIGAAMEVHRELGPGFLEAVYQESLAIEMELRGIPFGRESLLPVRYKGRLLAPTYRADFICYGDIIVETKTVETLAGIHVAQAINYMKATGMQRALLINFGTGSLQHQRLVRQLQSKLSSKPTQESA